MGNIDLYKEVKRWRATLGSLTERHKALETAGGPLAGYVGSSEGSRGGRDVFRETRPLVRAPPPENFTDFEGGGRGGVVVCFRILFW